MYISRVRLKRIRGFHDLDLRICDEDGEPRMRTAIIGVNGTGKTTLLRCLAMGLCGQADANALLSELPGRIITFGEKDAEIVIDVVNPSVSNALQTIETKISASDSHDAVESQTLLLDKTRFIVGYGIRATIGSETDFRQYRVLDSVYTLFNYAAELTSAEITLRRLRDYLGTDYYKKTLVEIKNALGLPPKVRFRTPKGGGVEISGPSIGRWIPLGSLADGYQITFTWILDLYAWAMRANVVTKTGSIKGVLLIDELEKNLHPSLQTNVLSRLQELWPDLQIIGTTHSPLVALGARPREVVVLGRKGNTVSANDAVPNFTGYSVEDMLNDGELFGTEVYTPEINRILSRYRVLAAKDTKKLNESEKNEIRQLASKLYTEQILPAEESPTHQDFRQLRKDLGLGEST